MAETQASSWGSVSKQLLATLYPVETGSDGSHKPITADGEVVVPATDIQVETTLNWQSPFENAGPESKAPQLMALIQSGQLAPVVNALEGVIKKYAPDSVASVSSNIANTIESKARELEGRTGITKLNSRQIFSGMPPIKISMKLHFRALKDGKTEVDDQYRKLLSWALPQYLAPSGVLAEALEAAVKNPSEILEKLFPSKSPRMICFKYANQRYEPMVIESLSTPIDGPRARDGYPLYQTIQLNLATLTALDRADVKSIFTR